MLAPRVFLWTVAFLLRRITNFFGIVISVKMLRLTLSRLLSRLPKVKSTRKKSGNATNSAKLVFWSSISLLFRMTGDAGYVGYRVALKLLAKETLPLKTLRIERTGQLEVERSFQVKNIKVCSDVLG